MKNGREIISPVNLYKSQQSTPPNAASPLAAPSRSSGTFWRAQTSFKVTCEHKIKSS